MMKIVKNRTSLPNIYILFPGEACECDFNPEQPFSSLVFLTVDTMCRNPGDKGNPGSEVRKAVYVKIAKPMNGKE